MYRQALLAAALFTGAAEPSPSTGRIEGTVRDSAGVPVANAQVIVVSRPWTAMSDSLGRFRLADIPAGRYTIQVSAIGYGRREVTGVSVTAGATTRLDLTLKPSTVDEVVAQTGVAKRAEADWREMSRMVPTQGAAANGLPYPAAEPMNTENYAVIEESRFLPAGTNPRSTFSIDVDAASYTNVRRFLTAGQRPPKDAVRIEELLNYFRYDYPEPEGKDRFSVTTDLAVAPWAPEHRLLRIGIKGRSLRTEAVPAEQPGVPARRIGLDAAAQQAPAGEAGVPPPGAGASAPGPGGHRGLRRRRRPRAALHARLGQGGDPRGARPAGGRRLHRRRRRAPARLRDRAGSTTTEKGNNRVILATDGDFNVGESSDAAMVRLIEERRDQGIFLTVLGFGTGNLKDSRMEQIADKGNGHYAYVDNLNEARRVFVREFAGTLVTIAKDVKIQVEFNPAKVAAYRLVGYENRALRNEDFADDRKDAGELGAGHTVTALYEIVPVGVSLEGTGGDLDDLKYQTVRPRSGVESDEWLTVQLRYKEPDWHDQPAADAPGPGAAARRGAHGRLPVRRGGGGVRAGAAGVGVPRDGDAGPGAAAGPGCRGSRMPMASGLSSCGWWSRRGCCRGVTTGILKVEARDPGARSSGCRRAPPPQETAGAS